MSKALAEIDVRDEWAALLEQTRQALSTLRAVDLEELAVRADRMSKVFAFKWRSQEDAQTLAPFNLSAEHRLLGSLLLATRRNLDVLQRSHAKPTHPDRTSEVNSQWVR
jgi:hypothetical protein